MPRTAIPTINYSHRPPTPDLLPRFTPNSYHLHHRGRLNSPIPTISATAPAGTPAGRFRSIPVEHSSARNILSSSNPATLRPYRIRINPASHVESDESPEYLRRWEDALAFGRALGIAHIVEGGIYRARLGARGPGAFVRDLFFDGRGTEEEEEEEGGDEESSGGGGGGFVGRFDRRDFAVGEGVLGGYYDGESDDDDMSSITHENKCAVPGVLACSVRSVREGALEV
ncbi:hypothetical protein HOY82DRAFT_669972 [Tuber indicum]|nr:hypothetical protein HOY82DRAFT_669972 [Tuber indicum]